MVDGALAFLQLGEEGVDPRDIALMQAQLAQLRKHQPIKPVPVGVDGRVLTPLSDLPHPDRRGVREPGIRTKNLAALTPAPAQLVLQRPLRAGSRRTPALHPPSHPVEIANPATSHPLPAIPSDLHRPVMADRSGGLATSALLPERVPSGSDSLIFREDSRDR